MNKRKTIFSLILCALITFGMSVGILASDYLETNNLRLVYQVESDLYKGAMYADDVMKDDTIPSQIEISIDEAIQFTNVLRVYAGECQELDPMNDSDQLAIDYLAEAGMDATKPSLVFLRGEHQILFKANEAFQNEYGEYAYDLMDQHAFQYMMDSENKNSYETNMCIALVEYMRGDYAAEEEALKESKENPTKEEKPYFELPDLSDSYEPKKEAKTYSNSNTQFKAVIEDDANLIKDDSGLLEFMQPITEYANIAFASTQTNYSSTPEHFAHSVGSRLFGDSTKYIVFLIDMSNRQLYICSSESMYKVLTTSKANIITDNVYRYASDRQYDQCAQKAFDQIRTVLDGDPLSSPMKFICCILIALVSGLTICWILMASNNTLKKASFKEIEAGMGERDFRITNVRKTLLHTRFVRHSSGSGRSGGGGFSGGGGGFHGGGGGHGF